MIKIKWLSLILIVVAGCDTQPRTQREHPYDTVMRELQSNDPTVRQRAYERGRAMTYSAPEYVQNSKRTTFITPLGDGFYQTSDGNLIVVH